MINLKPEILKALRNDEALLNLLGGPYVWHLLAGDPNKYPRITFFEIDNVDDQYADGHATVNNIYFQIDIWDKRPRQDIFDQVDRIMKSLGFSRISSGPDLFEPDFEIFHKAPRYCISKSLL